MKTETELMFGPAIGPVYIPNALNIMQRYHKRDHASVRVTKVVVETSYGTHLTRGYQATPPHWTIIFATASIFGIIRISVDFWFD